MKLKYFQGSLALSLIAAFALITGGCEQAGNKGATGKDKSSEVAQKKGNDHSGWWCVEHGVPEEACAQCNAKVAAEYKKKGDWCKEHDRPESQCFICRPELKEKFAAQYRAKYGKEPPPTEDEEKKDDKSKKEEKKG